MANSTVGLSELKMMLTAIIARGGNNRKTRAAEQGGLGGL